MAAFPEIGQAAPDIGEHVREFLHTSHTQPRMSQMAGRAEVIRTLEDVGRQRDYFLEIRFLGRDDLVADLPLLSRLSRKFERDEGSSYSKILAARILIAHVSR